MKRFLLLLILSCTIGTTALHAQGGYILFGYGACQMRYRPANLDIVRFNLDRGNNDPMDFPDYMRGFSFGGKLVFDENGSGEFLFSRRNAQAKAVVTDSLGNVSEYELRCRISSLSWGASVGVKHAQLGMSFDLGTFYVASRFNGNEWVPTFQKKRKIWFGHTFYASFILPAGKALMFELRPYWQTSWFSVRMGSDFPLMAFRPSNYGVMFIIGIGASE